MYGNTIKVTRQQLYEEVWSQPVYKVAMKYGLSDVGLAKVCNRNGIPKPPVGYWAKLEHGKKVGKPKLTKLEDEQPIEIQSHAARIGNEDPGLPNLVDEKICFEQQEINRIVVQEELTDPHPLVKNARSELRAATKDRDGLYKTPSQPHIAVSKPLIPRALLIMDALVKALESRGYQADGLKIFDEPVDVRLQESLQSQLTKAAKARREKSDYFSGYSSYDYERIPSGKLQLSIGGRDTYFGDGLRTNWADGKSQRVESVLNDFICGLIRRAAVDHETRLERERWHREREEENRKREDEARRKAEEKARIDGLYRDANHWAQANFLRNYVAAVVDKNDPAKTKPNLAEWEKWARAEADRIDPLTL